MYTKKIPPVSRGDSLNFCCYYLFNKTILRSPLGRKKIVVKIKSIVDHESRFAGQESLKTATYQADYKKFAKKDTN
jgi:hypothetical protein